MNGRDHTFENLCIFHILDGLRDGLSHYVRDSRVALVYVVEEGEPPRVCDPQHLLRGHEPRLRKFYLDSDEWRNGPPGADTVSFDEPLHDENLLLSGLVSFGGRSASVRYQRWFTEHHPDLCSVGPVKRWMEYATRLLSQNFANRNVLGIETAGHVLQECAKHAVRDHIVDERAALMGMDTHLRIYPLLDAVLEVSKTREEGAWARGDLVFVEPATMGQLHFLALFPHLERPRLENHKHVRKLLQSVERAGNFLVSDGRSILGVAAGQLPGFCVKAEFRGGHGFLRLGEDLICSFEDGTFHGLSRKAVLVQLEEALLESRMEAEALHELFAVVSRIVERAGAQKHGCALVVDLSPEPVPIAGQMLESPLDLRDPVLLDLAGFLSKVDGALHLRPDGTLHAFACLLDGHSVPGENRSRGARFNSAMRFTAEHDNVVVVVVSADRPVSVLQHGVERTAVCEWKPVSGLARTPPTLEAWLEG